jgi:hypothetical protein
MNRICAYILKHRSNESEGEVWEKMSTKLDQQILLIDKYVNAIMLIRDREEFL